MALNVIEGASPAVNADVVMVRWPHHASEIFEGVSSMRELGELLDVTLVTPDGETEAHRVVLAASSELLRSMLRKAAPVYGPCSMLIRDLSISQLELVLDLLYRGELVVDRKQLELLAQACDYLQIKASLWSNEGAVDEPSVDSRCDEISPTDELDSTEAPPVLVSTTGTGFLHSPLMVSAGGIAQSAKVTPAASNVCTETKSQFVIRGGLSEVVQDVSKAGASEHNGATKSHEGEFVHSEQHLGLTETYNIVEMEEERQPSFPKGYLPRRSRQEYVKRTKLTTIGDKKIFTLQKDAPSEERLTAIKPVKRFCRECNIIFNYLSDYKTHRLQKHALQCPCCNFRGTKASVVRDHFEKIHQNLRRFKCSECSFKCKDRATLHNHVRRHTNEKPYECAYCDYRAAQSASMKQHMALHENIESRPHRCDECIQHPISFSSRSALTKHKKAHHHGNESTLQLPHVVNLEIVKAAVNNVVNEREDPKGADEIQRAEIVTSANMLPSNRPHLCDASIIEPTAAITSVVTASPPAVADAAVDGVSVAAAAAAATSEASSVPINDMRILSRVIAEVACVSETGLKRRSYASNM